MNKVILKGRLTRDIETRYTNSSEPIAVSNFGIAVNRMKKDEVDFLNCSAFGKTAEFLNKYFIKGQEILIEGRIQIDKDEKDGQNKSYTNIIVEKAEFCGSKADNNKQGKVSNEQEKYDDLPF